MMKQVADDVHGYCDWCGKLEVVSGAAPEGRWMEALRWAANWVAHTDSHRVHHSGPKHGPDGPYRQFCSRRCRLKYQMDFVHSPEGKLAIDHEVQRAKQAGQPI